MLWEITVVKFNLRNIFISLLEICVWFLFHFQCITKFEWQITKIQKNGFGGHSWNVQRVLLLHLHLVDERFRNNFYFSQQNSYIFRKWLWNGWLRWWWSTNCFHVLKNSYLWWGLLSESLVRCATKPQLLLAHSTWWNPSTTSKMTFATFGAEDCKLDSWWVNQFQTEVEVCSRPSEGKSGDGIVTAH